MYGWRGRIGLIVPSPNTVAEIELRNRMPAGVEIYVARCLYPENADVDAKHLFYQQDVDALVIKAAQELATLKPDLIVWACTLGSMLQGPHTDLTLAEKIEQETQIPALTTTTAVIEDITNRGIQNMLILTPYPSKFSNIQRDYLLDRIPGLSVLGSHHYEIVGGLEKGSISPYDVYRKAMDMIRHHQKADGLLISCTNWPTLDILNDLRSDSSIEIVTSNDATLTSMLRRLNLPLSC